MNKLFLQPATQQVPRKSAFLRLRAQREAFRVERPVRSALPFLSLSLALGALAVLFALYTPCYTMSLDGVESGVVRNRTMVAETMTQVEGQVERILGREYTLAPTMDFSLTIAPKADLLSYSRLAEALYESVPEIKSAYVLSVDGVELGSASDKSTLDKVLTQVSEPFVREDTIDVQFANEARITRKFIPSEASLSDRNLLLASLRQDVTADTVYEVKSGDSLASIAAQYGMSEALLLEKNPKLATQKTVLEGQIITVQKTLPLLSVSTTEEVRYTQALTAPVREQADASLYEGERAILVQGMDGQADVRAKQHFVNGELQYEEVLARTTLVEPTETVVSVGTKERPSFYSTGSLQWPCQGQISSPFGYRSIFGGTSFHSGMDIANAYGTPIYAADSGVVTYVGYKGSYGNLIIIDHGNGTETYYSHSATTDVTLGQGVTKGDYIASMGATGRATGKHCHFEFRINGEPVNPANYLP